MSVGTHVDADVILEAKTLDAMLAAERARVRESEVAPLVALLRGVEERAEALGGYIGRDGQYIKQIRAALKAYGEGGR